MGQRKINIKYNAKNPEDAIMSNNHFAPQVWVYAEEANCAMKDVELDKHKLQE